MSGQLLGRAELDGLLDDVGSEAEHRGVRVNLFLVGGGAITLAYNDQRTTGDLDAVFEPTTVVRDIAETVARCRTERPDRRSRSRLSRRLKDTSDLRRR